MSVPVVWLILGLSVGVLLTVLIWKVNLRRKGSDSGAVCGSIVLGIFSVLWRVQAVRDDLRRIYTERRIKLLSVDDVR